MRRRRSLALAALLLALAAWAGEPARWSGVDPARPTDWQAPGNWLDGRVPGTDSDTVVIPGGCPAYPVLAAPLDLPAILLHLEGGATLSLGGHPLRLGAGVIDTPDSPDRQWRRDTPRGLVIEAGATLIAGDGGAIILRAGGLVNRGQVEGRPELTIEGHYHGFTLAAGGMTLSRLTLGSSAYPYPVAFPDGLTIAGDFHFAGGQVTAPQDRPIAVQGSLHMTGSSGPRELVAPARITIAGDLLAADAVCTGTGLLELVPPAPHRLSAGAASRLPRLLIPGGSSVSLDGPQVHSNGLTIDSGGTLHLQPGQRLVFGTDQPEWQRDPKANIVIVGARPWVRTRFSTDFVNRGRVSGVEQVPFTLLTHRDQQGWAVTGMVVPTASAGFNIPGSPLELKDGKLLLDGKEVKADDELDLDLITEAAEPTLTRLALSTRPAAEPPLAGLANLAPRARALRSRPSIGTGIYRLVDGDPQRGAEFRRGVTHAGTFEIDFGAPVEVRLVRFHQASIWAPRYVVYADTDGDGSGDRVLGLGDGQPQEWNWLAVPPTRCHRLYLRAREIAGGWEQSAPTLGELEVYATTAEASALPELPPPSTPPSLPRLMPGEPVQVAWPEVPDSARILRLITTDLWMFGLPPTQEALPKLPLAEFPPFVKTLDDFQSMGADGTLLFFEATLEACWPSVHFRSLTNQQFWKARDQAALPKLEGQAAPELPPVTLDALPNQRDLLRELVEAFHARRLKVHVVVLGRFFGSYVGPKGTDPWPLLLEEVAARGVDGISVVSDEAYLGMPNPDGEKRPADDPVRLAFRERFGPDASLPKDIWQRSVDYKRWVTFSYEQHALRLKRYGETVKAINPDCATFTVIGSHPVSCNNRMTYGLAYDVIGALANLDYLGTDYLPHETRLFAAANTPRSACMELFVPRSVRQGMTSALQGARSIGYYRYNYIAMQNSRDDRCREFALMDTLMRWGGTRAAAVPTVACLISRASEDWWDNDHGTNWLAHDPEAKRGFWSHRAINEFLLEAGLPHEVFYLDQPAALAPLGRYPLILLPFPYAIGPEAVSAVTRAHAAGANVLILQQNGAVGQYGEPLAAPALASLIAAGQADGSVVFLDRDLLAWETERDFAAQLAGQIRQMLGPRQVLHLPRPGEGVGSYLLANGRGGYLLALLNERDAARPVEVGLAVDPGDYELLACSSASTTLAHAGLADDRATWRAEELRRFVVELAAGEVRLIAVQPAGRPWPELVPGP